jgi:hypothetical protein
MRHQHVNIAFHVGAGLMVTPARVIVDAIVVANDNYLSPLQPGQAVIYLRAGVTAKINAPVLSLIRTLCTVR